MSGDFSAPGNRRYLRIGKYEVLRHLATGGMGAVYKARDTDLGRDVALKVLAPELAANPSRRDRFQREARHGARLRHENLVTIYDCGEANGFCYIALELVEGTDLLQYIGSKGKLEPAEAVTILTQAAKALDHAHRHGVIHRDIKPSNFLLAFSEQGLQVKLTDFGVARLPRDDESRLTLAGLTVGTVDYMAPEQARDSSLADARSDLYSLGCTLYHMLTGQPPFAEGAWTERVYKHSEAEPIDVRRFNPQVSARLLAVLQKLMAKKPADRYQTAAELLQALQRLDREPEPSPRPVLPVVPKRRPLLELPPEDSSVLLGFSPEQLQAAAGQFARAKQVLATGNYEYAVELLLSCCKLDPANIVYRRILRRVVRATRQKRGSRAWLSSLAGRGRVKTAKRSGDYRKVLEYGEEELTAAPDDIGLQRDMAEAAEALGLTALATWLLEQARKVDPDDLNLQRSLARLYEQRGNFPQAIALWEQVRRAAPGDPEAHHKVTDLAARETIVRGNYAGLAPEEK